MDRRFAMLALATLAAGLALLLLEGRDDTGPAMRSGEASAIERLGDEVPPAVRAPGSRPPAAMAASAWAEAEDAGDDRAAIVIEVRDADGRPAVGAEVRAVAIAAIRGGEGALLEHRWDGGARLLAGAPAWEADAAGRVSCDLAEGPTLIEARMGDRVARRFVEARREPESVIVLSLARPEGFDVKVVDGAGAPVAGAPVELRWIDTSVDLLPWSGPRRRRTAASGVASFRYPRGALDRVRAATHLFARLAIPLAEPITAPVTRFEPDAEPVVLVMPPHGAVEVSVRLEDGRPCVGRVLVGLHDLAAPGGIDSLGESDGSAYAEAGIARFEHVPLGRRLVAESGSFTWRARRSFTGPEVPGATARVALIAPPLFPRVRATLLDGQGRPAVRRAFDVRYFLDCRMLQTTTASDAVGAIELSPFAIEGALSDAALSLESIRGDAQAFAELGAVDPSLEAIDLGVVRLEPDLPLVAGRVRERDGRSAASVNVLVQCREAPTERSPWTGHLGCRQVPTDAEGRFSIPRPVPSPEGPLRLCLWRGFLSKAVPFEAGTVDLDLAWPEGATLAGRVLLPPELPARSIVLYLEVAEPDTGSRLLPARWAVDAEGRFLLERLPPGRAVLRISGAGAELPATGDIALREGETTHDARLDPLDLRPRLNPRQVTVSVTTEDGAPLAAAHVICAEHVRSDVVWHGPLAPDATGRVRFTILDPHPSFHARAFGYPDHSLRTSAGDPAIVMRKPQRVRLSWPAAQGRLPPDHAFELSFERGQDEHPDETSEEDPGSETVARTEETPAEILLDARGEATVAFASTGWWTATVSIVHLDSWTTYDGEELGIRPVSFEIHAGARTITIEAPLPDVDVAARLGGSRR